jgi:hypothetical protein
MKTAMGLLVALISLCPAVSLSCSFDTDCSPRSRFLKDQGALYGVCVGGISAGNSNDKRPACSPLDPSRTLGNTCGFDIHVARD